MKQEHQRTHGKTDLVCELHILGFDFEIGQHRWPKAIVREVPGEQVAVVELWQEDVSVRNRSLVIWKMSDGLIHFYIGIHLKIEVHGL